MDKLLFVFLLFIANLGVAFPIIQDRISAQSRTARNYNQETTETKETTIKNRHEKIDSIPETCKDIEICKLYYKIFRFCKKIRKCTL